MGEEFDSLAEELSLMKLMGLPTKFTSKKDERKQHYKQPDRLIGPRKLANYQAQKYSLFSRFDEGIDLDEESWYSVTPEGIAAHIASRCMINGTCTILDAFCGAGGSAIQFALASPHIHVIAVDINPRRIEMAKHNAKIYGVDQKIDFIVADFIDIAKTGLKCDVVFLSPPWGGPSYADVKKYPLNRMTPDGNLVFEMASKISHNIAFYVPKNIDEDALKKLAGVNGLVEIEENIVMDRRGHRCKAKTAYYGDLIISEPPQVQAQDEEKKVSKDEDEVLNKSKEEKMKKTKFYH